MITCFIHAARRYILKQPITFDYTESLSFFREEEVLQLQRSINTMHDKLHQKTGEGSEFTGWVDWPVTFDRNEFARIKVAARKITAQSDVLLVIGIGGSYLGARAALEMLTHTFYNQISKDQRQAPEIYFLGHHLSATYLRHLFELLEGKDISVNVISKSGTTTEPAIAFRLVRELMEEKYGKSEAKQRIYATTDERQGALKQLSDEEGYETFVIPDDIGGRYSVLTAVGLLPIAVSGVDIDEIMEGAKHAYQLYFNSYLEANPCYQYAAVRNILYHRGKTIELLVNYEPSLHSFAEWWKQLFGESEGKNHKGIFPASVSFTTDLHSMGQYIQDGRRDLFETTLHVERMKEELLIPFSLENVDGLNFLAGQPLGFVNQCAMEGTLRAHRDGGVPNLVVRIPELTPYYFGQLVYFFEKACAISGYLLGVNPFDQPGVEAYKKNMFDLLRKSELEVQLGVRPL
jgi:glucose-6-phosphate isomerase